ncbi:unnamed protein product [Pedinophyceae sp. YPF-701]|nr:unnamed protein product [Pedinophyceae sp. YPF-701]
MATARNGVGVAATEGHDTKDDGELPPLVDYVLDKSAFREERPCTALRVPAKRTGEIMAAVRPYLFKVPRMRTVVTDPATPDTRIVVLAGPVDLSLSHLAADVREKIVSDADIQVIKHVYEIPYEHFQTDQVLKRILPDAREVPTAFETVGHIAHLNIPRELMPWRKVIGEVVLDKNPAIKTVLTKVGAIENEFRVFRSEVLAGEPDLVATVTQGGLRFRLDFGKVYWNSRLEGEHERLSSKYFREGQVVCDMMCGVGPFAVRAAARGCEVWANDLNPESVKWLRINAHKNKVGKRVRAFNACGRTFLRALAGTLRPPPAPADGEGGVSIPEGGVYFDHVVMNLPASAVEFLDAMAGAFPAERFRGRMPLVHVYTFLRGTEEEAVANVRSVVEQHLGGPLDGPPEVHNVRDVAPGKHMLCVSFRVPEAIGLARSDAAVAGRKRKASGAPGNAAP